MHKVVEISTIFMCGFLTQFENKFLESVNAVKGLTQQESNGDWLSVAATM